MGQSINPKELSRTELLQCYERFGFTCPEAFEIWLDGPKDTEKLVVELINRIASLEAFLRTHQSYPPDEELFPKESRIYGKTTYPDDSCIEPSGNFQGLWFLQQVPDAVRRVPETGKLRYFNSRREAALHLKQHGYGPVSLSKQKEEANNVL